MHFFWDSTCPISPQQICRWIFSWDPDKPKFPPIRSWNITSPEIDIPNFPQTDLGIHFRRKPDMFHFPPNRSGTALFLRFGHAPFPPKQIWKSPFLGFGHLESPQIQVNVIFSLWHAPRTWCLMVTVVPNSRGTCQFSLMTLRKGHQPDKQHQPTTKPIRHPCVQVGLTFKLFMRWNAQS